MTDRHGDDESFLREALPAFLSEAREQLDQLEQLLLELEATPDDRELLDALFRCAHTIKGSAGLFGLDEIVAFTHHVETFLDALREGTVRLVPAINDVLLRCADQVRRLVARVDGSPLPDGAAGDDRDTLIEALAACLPGAHAPAPTAGDGAAAAAAAAIAQGAPSAHQIALHFKTDTFRDGFDPLAILDYLATLGTLSEVAIAPDRLPTFEALHPEDCHLDLSMVLASGLHAGQVDAAFDLVREDCIVRVAAAGMGSQDALARIERMDAEPRIGEILVASGAVHRTELDAALDEQARLARDDRAVPLGQVLRDSTGVPRQVVEAAARKQRGRDGEDGRTVRVPADRLDAVINLLGELVIAGAGTALLAQKTGVGELIESSHQLGRLIEEVRNGTLQLRMVPVGETFARFRRVVRDVASELGKDVQLEIVGGETELDKSVVEHIADPLMHLVRNALDHGLEPPAERVAAGKPPQGRLVLSACHESGGILIRIQDDGRGVRRDRVLARAWERGLLEQGVVPPDDEILRLIFEPGFSTAETVTNLSGRGVGMDVVRRNIEALRGAVTIRSEVGAGSTIEIRLPLTLAIIDGFMIGVGPSKFIFPLESVVEVIETRPADSFDVSSAEARAHCIVELRGQVLPVVGLRALYGLDSPEPERSSIVVLKASGQHFGVRVDALLGQHQTVIKPLGRMFRSLRGMSGSSILGTGEVALIFDVAALSQLAAHSPRTHHDAPPAAGAPRPLAPPAPIAPIDLEGQPT
ncbi:MAG: chemotaxis protein CheA [Burkholderiales bacterium]|nr:MAG: chemotaxis protein CheA [Burkholderiales bacterium]